MSRAIHTLTILTLLLATSMQTGCGALRAHSTRPHDVPTPARADIDSAIHRGVDFLLHSQNADGSWGSARNTTGQDVTAPIPGAHYAFRAAVTAMCISALIDTKAERTFSPAAGISLDRAETWLLDFLPHVKRNDTDVIYNVWTHSYALSAMRQMLVRHAADPARCAKIRAAMEDQLQRLTRYEFLGGGWGYYDFEAQTQVPAGNATSFTTATCLVGLYDARAAGLTVPQHVIDRAIAQVQRQRKPDMTYLYSRNWWIRPTGPVNQEGGSLGRSHACNFALRLWDDKAITDYSITMCLDRLFARNGWLDIGRKRPIPHESYYQVAGYFFFYGHYYAARSIDLLPPAERPFYQDQLATVLLHVQEKDGSWWDFPLYNYHQPYGTAFALMSLQRCYHATGT